MNNKNNYDDGTSGIDAQAHSDLIDGIKAKFELMKFIGTFSAAALGVLCAMKPARTDAVAWMLAAIVLCLLGISLFNSIVAMSFLADELKRGGLSDDKHEKPWFLYDHNRLEDVTRVMFVAGTLTICLLLLYR